MYYFCDLFLIGCGLRGPAFQPGINKEHGILKGMQRFPGLFWPCEVDLADKLPEGVTGEVLMRSSPLSFTETPPPDLNPLGYNQREGYDHSYFFIASFIENHMRFHHGILSMIV